MAFKLSKLSNIVSDACRVFDRIGQGFLIAMFLLVCANILLRIIWQPIRGTFEIVELLGSVVVSCSIAYCALQKGHVAIGFIVERFSPRTQAIIDIVAGIISFGLFIIIVWQLGEYGTRMWRAGETSLLLGIPLYPFAYCAGFGCLLITIVILIDLSNALSKARRR